MALWLTVLCCSLLGATDQDPLTALPVDDFSGDLSAWQSSTRAQFHGPEPHRQGLRIETEDGQRVLRAAFGFADPIATEPIFITRRFATGPERQPIRAVRFRYRWEVDQPAGATAAPVSAGGFLVRLRTSPTDHTNFEVPRVDGSYPVGEWVAVTIETNLFSPRARNIYRYLPPPGADPIRLTELTFRLDDIDELNASGTLWLADIELLLAEDLADQPYQPVASPRPASDRLRLLDLVHSSDAYYRIPVAARLLDPAAEVTTALFRGLHFPLWEYPAERDGVLANDVIFLGDVDPWVLTNRQLQHLADAVASGVGLLAAAGPNSFGGAHRRPPALLDLLPVDTVAGEISVGINAMPAVAGDHPLLAGLDAASLGLVRQVVPVTVRPGAQVLLTAGGRPLLIVAETAGRRVVVLTSWAQPARLDDGSFMVAETWSPFASRLLAWLAGRDLPTLGEPVPAAGPARLTARWLYSKPAMAPGSRFGLEVALDPAEVQPGREVRAELECRGETLWQAAAPAATEVRLEGVCGHWAPGAVTARVSLAGSAEGLAASLTGWVVDPLRREDFYPIITYLPTGEGGHAVDPAWVDDKVAEVAAHGFNTVAVGGLGASAGGGIGATLRGWAEATAARQQMASILEYTHFSAYRRDRPYELSPWDEGFEAMLAKRLAPGVEQAAFVPRLLSVKFVDEPFASPANVVDTPAARAAFQRVTGRAWLTREEAGADPAAAYAYGRFLSALVEADFAAARRIRDAAGAPWDLLHTFCSPGYGGGRPLDEFEDTHRWPATGDRFDFDVYPYFYPHSDRIRFVEADWCLAASRVTARRLDQPWGFYFELDDRNYPYQVNPPEASAECAFQAVAAGADYLNSFILRGFGSGHTGRPERWAMTGEAVREIEAIGPLLTRWPRQPSRVAVLLPEAHWLCRNGYQRPVYTRALLAQATGDADVLHEDEFASQPPPALQVLVLAGAEILRRDCADRLVEWVAQGGQVVLDRLPSVDEANRPLTWPAAFIGDPGRHPHGSGAVLVVESGLETRLKEAVEGEQDGLWAAELERLRSLLGPLLKRAEGVVAITVASDPREVDIGIRHDGASGLLMVVNHHPEPQTVVVWLDHLPFPVHEARLLPALTPWPVEVLATGRLRFEIEVPGRWARMIGLWQSWPDAIQIRADDPARPGELLSYQVAVTADGRPAPGSYPVTVTVSAGDLDLTGRLGGERTVSGGLTAMTGYIPINLPGGGDLRLTATLAGSDLRAEVRLPMQR